MILSANIFIVLAIIIAIFQVALFLGAPLGEYTLGGKFPGKLPAKVRAATLIQILILMVFVIIVTAKAGIAFDQYNSIAQYGIWFVVAFFILGTLANLSSPSKKEKLIMGPANIIALVCTVIVALG